MHKGKQNVLFVGEMMEEQRLEAEEDSGENTVQEIEQQKMGAGERNEGLVLSGRVRAICISEKRGTEKQGIDEAWLIPAHGIQGDAHAGNWHRQVSLLSYERVKAFNARGAAVKDGAFGENLVVEDIDFRALPVGTLLHCGQTLLRMTQIGKECHTHCQIYHRMGECIMPVQGVFAEVLQGGRIQVGDVMQVELPAADRPFTAAVITLSDSGARGQRVDESGPLAAGMLREQGYEVVEELLLSDDKEGLKKHLIRLADQRQVSLILTSGGTGFSLRDQAPEAAYEVMDRNAPGIAEAIRAASMEITKRAMLSRAASVIRGQSLIINLPGSPKAVRESLEAVLDTLPHGLGVLRGTVHNCAVK